MRFALLGTGDASAESAILDFRGFCIMPSWSNKDERQYEHIKESATKRGQSTERAKEIAARTVNKKRREEGRTETGKTKSGKKKT